jgi:hypothetical protein
MSNVNSATINFLNNIYSQTQNNVKTIIGLKAFLDGPFKLNIGTSESFRNFKEFLNTGKFTTRLGTRGNERELLQFDLLDSPKKIFQYDKNDIFLNAVLNACVNEFVLADGNHRLDIEINELIQKQYRDSHKNFDPSASLKDASDIRKHFYDNYFYNYDNYYTKNSAGRVLKKFNNGANPISIAQIVKSGMTVRINSWIKAKQGRANKTDEQLLIQLEKAFLTEEYDWDFSSRNIEENTGLRDFIDKAINRSRGDRSF